MSIALSNPLRDFLAIADMIRSAFDTNAATTRESALSARSVLSHAPEIR
jgi:hypothetical protein